MRIASWNVNSMKARIEHVLAFLGTDKCDVLLAQELKLTDENFPTDSFTKNGWHVETHGQKTYNGVAIISRYPISDVARAACHCWWKKMPKMTMHGISKPELIRLISA